MMKKTIALMFVLAFVGVSPVMADTISDSAPIVSTTVGTGQTVYLDQFDTSLGVLTGVTLTLDANAFAGSIDWDNEANVPSDVTLGIGTELTAVGPDAITLVAVPVQTASGSVDADNDGAADFIGTDAFAVTGGTGSDSDAESPVDFTPYKGTGTFAVDVTSVVETFLSTTGGFGPIQNSPGSYDGTVTVEYTYIPEPATMCLLGLGALGLIRRKK
jgi:hypothetical protein